jgi:hypothetical protein
MYALLLQDWVTIRSGSGGSITQGEASWLDLSSFLDIVAFVETKNFAASAGSLFAAFQTSPTKDAVLFQSMNDVTAATGTALALGVQTFVLLRDTALCPLARWLRWQLVAPSASTYEATFRIWIAANAPGGYAQSALEQQQADASGAGGPSYTGGFAVGDGAPYKMGTIPSNMPQVQMVPQTGYTGIGNIPGVHQYSAFKGVGYIPGVKQWQPRDWRQGIAQTIPAPVPAARVPFIPLGTKVTR